MMGYSLVFLGCMGTCVGMFLLAQYCISHLGVCVSVCVHVCVCARRSVVTCMAGKFVGGTGRLWITCSAFIIIIPI